MLAPPTLASLFAPGIELPASPRRGTRLQLNDTDLGDQGAQVIAAKLRENESVEHLDLTSAGISDVGAEALFGALESSHLKELVLAENELTGKAIRALAPALTSRCCTLQHLDLSCNNIGNEGARLLAGMLMLNTSLRSVRLQDTQIGDDGATALARALRVNKSLEMLDLASNTFDRFSLSEMDQWGSTESESN